VNQIQSNRILFFLLAMTIGLCPVIGYGTSVFPDWRWSDEEPSPEEKPQAISQKQSTKYIEDGRAMQSVPASLVTEALGGIDDLNWGNKNACLGPARLFDSASALDLNRTWKSPEELKKYIHCYLPPNEKYHTEFDKHAEKIAKAGVAFGLPPNLVECAFLRESKFISESKSHKACVGIAQIKAATANYIGQIIRENPESSSRKDKYQMEQTALGGRADQLKAQGVRAKSPFRGEFARRRINAWHYDTVESWRKYHSMMGLKDPGTYEAKSRTDPDRSIPAGAFYFKFISVEVLNLLNVNDPAEQAALAKDPRFAQCIAAIYNWGPRGFQNLAIRYQKAGRRLDTIDQVLEMLQKGAPRETRNYMYAIKTCSERDNFRSYETPDHRRDLSCKDTQ
jgi:hypothetical protein